MGTTLQQQPHNLSMTRGRSCPETPTASCTRGERRSRSFTGALFAGGLLVALCFCGCVAEKTNSQKQKSQEDGEQSEKTFTPLTLNDFDVYTGQPAKQPANGEQPADDVSTWSEKDRVIVCTGKPRGYIYTKQTYRNFELKFEYRFEPSDNPADKENMNTGCLVYLQGEHRLWPTCLEVQGKWMDMGRIKSNARHIKVHVDDEPELRMESRMQPGNWNELSVTAQDGQLSVKLNGRIISASRPTELKQGRLGFQSEGWPVQFRNIRIWTPSDKTSQ